MIPLAQLAEARCARPSGCWCRRAIMSTPVGRDRPDRLSCCPRSTGTRAVIPVSRQLFEAALYSRGSYCPPGTAAPSRTRGPPRRRKVQDVPVSRSAPPYRRDGPRAVDPRDRARRLRAAAGQVVPAVVRPVGRERVVSRRRCRLSEMPVRRLSGVAAPRCSSGVMLLRGCKQDQGDPGWGRTRSRCSTAGSGPKPCRRRAGCSTSGAGSYGR